MNDNEFFVVSGVVCEGLNGQVSKKMVHAYYFYFQSALSRLTSNFFEYNEYQNSYHHNKTKIFSLFFSKTHPELRKPSG